MLRRIISIICVSLCSVPFLAAETLPAYVVSATTEEENVLDVPASVSVITADEIVASGKTSVVEVLETVPGVSFRSGSTDAQAQVSMRGFGENSFGRVLVLVDGRELNNPDMAGLNWQSVPLSSISRIEVLDGPAAVLYGSGAVGGVINIITKESAPRLSAGATLSYGSFNTREYRLNGGFGTDRLGFLVSIDRYTTDGYRDRSKDESTNAALNGFADITDTLTIKPSLTYSDIYFQMPGALTKAEFEDDPTQAIYQKDSGSERDFGAALETLWTATDMLSVRAPFEYAYKARRSNSSSLYMGTFSYFYYDYTEHRFGARPSASVEAESAPIPVRVTAGLDFGSSLYTAEEFGESSRDTKTSEYDFVRTSVDPYLSANFSLTPVVSLRGGLRYSVYTLAVQDGLSGKDWDSSSGSLVYDLALNWRPAPALSGYASFGTLYRVPFLDEILTYGTFLDHLVPETGYNAELGVKYAPARFVSFDANAYFMMMDDEIAYNVSTGQNENLDRTRRVGGKLSAQLKPVSWLRIDGNLSYVDAVFDSGAYKGESVPLVPALEASVGATFVLPAGFTVGSTVSYTGEQTDSGSLSYPDSYGTLDPYTLVGLSAGFVPPAFGGKLAVNAKADNLLDTSYASYVYWGAYYPAEGRSFTVSVSYTY